MQEDTTGSRTDIRNEVARSIAWPRQAVSYKVGRPVEAEGIREDGFSGFGHELILVPHPCPSNLRRLVHSLSICPAQFCVSLR